MAGGPPHGLSTGYLARAGAQGRRTRPPAGSFPRGGAAPLSRAAPASSGWSPSGSVLQWGHRAPASRAPAPRARLAPPVSRAAKPVRKSSDQRRPRFKGRFVRREELEALEAMQRQKERGLSGAAATADDLSMEMGGGYPLMDLDVEAYLEELPDSLLGRGLGVGALTVGIPA